MRVFAILVLAATLGGCFAGGQEVRARLGQEYIGKNVDALVVQWDHRAARLNSIAEAHRMYGS